MGRMYYEELNESQKHQLAEAWLLELVDLGIYAEVMDVEWDEPSWGELANASELVPEDVLEEKYDGTVFTEDDFF